MLREIGSEYWLDKMTYSRLNERAQGIAEATVSDMKEDYKKRLHLPESEDTRIVFSGRTALDMVIQDIKSSHRPFNNIRMPSYCCYSMVQPFYERGIAVEFYPVNYIDGMHLEIEMLDGRDILFTTDYFGYAYTYERDSIEAFRKQGGIVIHDATHGFLRDDFLHIPYDYQIVSLRKWSSVISGALAMKKNGDFIPYSLEKAAGERIDPMYRSLALKSDYIQGGDIDKKTFNTGIRQYHECIDSQYRHLDIDTISLLMLLEEDRITLRERRRDNAKHIHERLRSIPNLKPLFSFSREAVPLNVPVAVSERKRDKLQRFMADNDVFLPVHWGDSSIVDCPKGDSNLYSRELSLVCDQRYSSSDITREMDLIETFMRT